ncbi:ATP-binding cassette domain-containing protein [Streptomyces aculeolatus]|uniref:ATP-binding cassette domain-containing protein n=1 Tax=Streptomyces aculeolatus TaxID=270689 RepID=UPI001CECC2EF|nr:ATP-binding cassette domain-containing protein [Streptomyces aculeolatus]
MGAAHGADPAVEAVDLIKSYPAGRSKPPVTALRGLSFTAATGTVFGLLGPNGAGKTTAVKILSTLSAADSGSARVAGYEVATRPARVRRTIGYVSQKSGTDPMGTATENLLLAGRLHGMSRRDAAARARELLGGFGLADAADRLVQTYSGGMARKLDLALSLMHRPRVLFLDEPTTGLDPRARGEVWAEVARLTGAEQMTVLLTTHYLEEADHLADRLAIVDRGRVVASGTPDELKSGLRGDAVHVELARADDRAPSVVRTAPGLRDVTVRRATVRGRADDGARALPLVLAALEEAGIAVNSATLARPSLDDVYLRHTGRSLNADADADDAAPEAVEVAE